VLIDQDNPKTTDDRMAYAIKQLKEVKIVNGDAAAAQGIGGMTEARWHGGTAAASAGSLARQ
jgi:NitT/TauT family transport system substrate-binding protein